MFAKESNKMYLLA